VTNSYLSTFTILT